MKKNLLSAILFIATANAFATVHTVSNQSPNPGQYTTIQAAINVATAGDTVYVHPSQFPYDDFSLNKLLTIMGNGIEPSTANPNPYSIIQYTNPQAGIHVNSINASGSKFIGLYLTRMDFAQGIHDITITRCSVTLLTLPANMYNLKLLLPHLLYKSEIEILFS